MTRTEFLHQFHHLRLTRREPDYPLKAEARPAAVLIPLLDYGDKLHVLLTERAQNQELSRRLPNSVFVLFRQLRFEYKCLNRDPL